ncbi:excisionase family DNA-binding protein [Sphingomonas sp.]|uniref:excisionase family DNA-binding protein n=1 Tax=Sphingomonas sp. TaxID=28214 RepID=UPI003AFF8E0B
MFCMHCVVPTTLQTDMEPQMAEVWIDEAEPLTVRVGTACRHGLGRTTIYELMKSGRLRSVKVGRARLIDRASLCGLLHD